MSMLFCIDSIAKHVEMFAYLHLLWILLIHLNHCRIACENLPLIHGPHSHHHLQTHIHAHVKLCASD